MTFGGSPHAIDTSPTSSIASITSVTSIWSTSTTSSNATSVVSNIVGYSSAPPTSTLPQFSSHSISAPGVCRGSTAPESNVPADKNSVSRHRPSASGLDNSTQPVPIEQGQHPRRSRLVVGKTQPCSAAEGCPLPPVPSLQRQADRKVNFVENLVDSAAQIVETIWQPPKHLAGSPSSGSNDVVLPLRTFIQETLRRSRTSYSTLQVALYYLIVIRPYLPAMDRDISDLQPEEAQLIRAKQCGRRMFLAALILASKYLQDRNYSARAWSKISGLNTQEINVNEMTFLRAIDYRLHISELVFQKWSDLVLKYTTAPSPSPVSPTRSSPWIDEDVRKREWCELVLRLSPDLREVDLEIAPANLSLTLAEPGSSSVDCIRLATQSCSTPKVQISHSPPTRTIKSELQDANVFNALDRFRSTNNSSLSGTQFQSPSCQTPKAGFVSDVRTPAVGTDNFERKNECESATTTPKVGTLMVPVACSAKVFSETGYSQEAHQTAGLMRHRPEMPQIAAIESTRCGLAMSVITLDEHSPVPATSSLRITIPKSPSPQKIRDATSPATSDGLITPTLSSIQRKRSCPSVYGGSNPSSVSSGTAPRILGLCANRNSPGLRCNGASPVIGSPSLSERGGKRARRGWELDGLSRGLAQGVR
jgi:hypothetical protein